MPPVSALFSFQHHQNQLLMGLCSVSDSGPGVVQYVIMSARNCAAATRHELQYRTKQRKIPLRASRWGPFTCADQR